MCDYSSMLGLKLIHVSKSDHCITGLLWGKPLVTNGFPSHSTSNAELWCFLYCKLQQAVEQKWGCQLFEMPRSKKTSKLCVTGLCEGNSPMTGEFLAQRASNVENVSIWWHHHGEFYVWITPTHTPTSVMFKSCHQGPRLHMDAISYSSGLSYLYNYPEMAELGAISSTVFNS